MRLDRPPRVLFLASFFPKPGNPTMGTWALGQARGLKRQGANLTVVSFTSWVPPLMARSKGALAYADCPPEHDWDGVTTLYPRWLFYPVQPFKRWAGASPSRQLALAWHTAKGTLRRLVRERRPDVIFCHHTLPNGYLAERLRREGGPPYVVTDHHFGEINDCARFPDRRCVYERVVRNAAAVVAVSNRMEHDIARLFPGAGVLTVHNGVDPPHESRLDEPRPAVLEGKTVVLSCGMFTAQKAFPLLIRAFARVAPHHPSAVLRIVGDGAERPAIEEAIRLAGMGDRVQLTGRQDHGQVMREMAWCDLFALVGADEAFATVFIEAMGCGKPIITASDGGINDVVEDGVHGLSVPPHDEAATSAALDRLLADARERRRMGAAARRLVETSLTWDANARTMIDLFFQAIQAR